jgi:ribonuclease-3
MNDLATLQQLLGVSFNDTSLLRQALIHSSYANENPGPDSPSNERLEFLGDAVLGMVVAGKLYIDFPHYSEGEMTKLRSRLVRKDTLARVAREIGLDKFLILGRGEENTGGRSKPSNLARSLEAVIGAVYIKEGLEVTRNVILRLLDREWQVVINRGIPPDYKSELQEMLQSRGQPVPTYHIINASGPDHNRTFTVEVRLNDNALGTGTGRSKKAAETDAARTVLKNDLVDFTR